MSPTFGSCAAHATGRATVRTRACPLVVPVATLTAGTEKQQAEPFRAGICTDGTTAYTRVPAGAA